MPNSYAVELERLLLMMEPKLAEQIQAARELTEQEISMLIQRFSSINEELKHVFDLAELSTVQQSPENLTSLKASALKVRKEIDVVLEAMQFQDRVSQILTLVQANLGVLRDTLKTIQQGTERDKTMLNVEGVLAHIQTQYESVKHHANSQTSDQPTADDLTFFK